MKTYANFIYLGNLLAQCPGPEVNPVIYGVYQRLFKPKVKIVAEDCGTKIGTIRPVNNKLVWSLELKNSDIPVDSDRVKHLLENGITHTPIRSVESCLSEGGICRKCLYGSYQYVDPAFDKTTLTSYPLFSTVPSVGSSIAMDFTGTKSVPFLTYLTNTYSGQVLGMKSYLSDPLPLREGLLRSYIPDPVLTIFIQNITDAGYIPTLELNYANSLNSKLEKVLFLFSQHFLGYYTKNSV